MSKIRILPENLANQIAAGEVVERPASVVKEFVENAIDAGAQNISVDIEGGGSRLIRVIDDGEGMDQDDILLSLERHATSKIVSSEQLSSIHTLGFRGEAIPSIASVSRLTITSRVRGADLGHRAEIRFGQLTKVHEMGSRPGTVMEVRDLFGNVPARRKFLKTERTELYHVEEIILNTALAFPQRGINYSVNGKAILSFAGNDTLLSRVKQIVASGIKSPLVEIEHRKDGFVIFGFLLPPDEMSNLNAKLRVFVNQRPVRDRMISHGVTEGLHGFLMKGRRPAGVLFLELDPAMVDVNVHPTKQEIRFHQSSQIHKQVITVLSQAMAKYQQGIHYALFGKPDLKEKEIVYPSGSSDKTKGSWEEKETFKRNQVEEPPAIFAGNSQESFPAERREFDLRSFTGTASECEAPPIFSEPKHEEARRFKYVGQFMKCYLLCETEDGIAVIDQHAAHERLLFERMKKEYNALNIPGQSLLFPQTIECSPAQVEVVEKYGEEIARIGLILQDFGGGTFAVKSVPAILSHLGPREIINGIFDQYLNPDSKGTSATRIEDILAVMACKAAVKAHDVLSHQEGEALLLKMQEADIFSHCPHGRPVVKVFSEYEVKRWFFR